MPISMAASEHGGRAATNADDLLLR